MSEDKATPRPWKIDQESRRAMNEHKATGQRAAHGYTFGYTESLFRIIENANLDGQRHAYWTALMKLTSSTFAETVDWLKQQIKDDQPVKDATETKMKTPCGTDVHYIDDGVYAEFDGYGVWLLANSHDKPTDKIYLEPYVLETIWRMLKTGGLTTEEE